ncbi:hypothetical protein ACIQU5_07015 [Streptomyces sp. NPDC090306]|uniref:hypothetical protein n=1 Tax=Streptomyces sp. NPDC090306 TaxID=3365961 RepID=UPI0038028FBA
MTNSDDQTHTSHTPGSQPSVHPGSDEPQTITAPTPPVAWSSGPPEEDDIAHENAGPEQPHAHRDANAADQDD